MVGKLNLNCYNSQAKPKLNMALGLEKTLLDKNPTYGHSNMRNEPGHNMWPISKMNLLTRMKLRK